MDQLKGKTALVTGGSSGIGLATARRFVDEGARVYLTGRREAELDSAARDLGTSAVPVRSDVSEEADLDQLFERVKLDGQGLDVVFANAGGGEFASLDELTPEGFDRTFMTNVRGTVFTVQKALPLLNESASIVVTGSSSARRGIPSFGAYSASKAALGQFVRVWAAELSPRGIRINTIVPGTTDTPGLRGLNPDDQDAMLKQLAGATTLGRVAHPEEIAASVLFLATNESSFVTGTELTADGGER